MRTKYDPCVRTPNPSPKPLIAHRVRIAAYALAIDDGHVLLARVARGYPNAGQWTLPGGGLEFGESPEDALNRELTEETGLIGAVEQLVGIGNVVLPATRERPALQWIRILYRVRCSGEPLAETDGSTDLASWISLDELGVIGVVELVAWAMATAGSEHPR